MSERKGLEVRTDVNAGKYELMEDGRRIYEFRSASELHELVLQALSTLRWSLGPSPKG